MPSACIHLQSLSPQSFWYASFISTRQRYEKQGQTLHVTGFHTYHNQISKFRSSATAFLVSDNTWNTIPIRRALSAQKKTSDYHLYIPFGVFHDQNTPFNMKKTVSIDSQSTKNPFATDPKSSWRTSRPQYMHMVLKCAFHMSHAHYMRNRLRYQSRCWMISKALANVRVCAGAVCSEYPNTAKLESIPLRKTTKSASLSHTHTQIIMMGYDFYRLRGTPHD